MARRREVRTPRSGSDHNLYIGALTSFTLTDSYVSDEQGYGHEVKSVR